MNKKFINVPRGIKYISDWADFEREFPERPCIINKMVTGCGFTEWAITNQMNVILCSPRNILLDNKAEQHPGEVYRVRSAYYDKDLEVDKNMEDPKDCLSEEELLEIRKIEGSPEENKIKSLQKVEEDLESYFIGRNILPKKILVTYDSFHLVKDALIRRGIFDTYYVIVDEFQSIFTDSRFKSEVEMEFVDQLAGIQNLFFVSATPMMENYLDMIDDFRDLPYYELDWEALQPGRTMKPQLEIRTTRSINESARDIIEKYKNGDYETNYVNMENGEIKAIESREAIFYVNSVHNIIQIIRKNHLRPEEVNILCASTVKNWRNIKNKLGEKFGIGKIPLPGEGNKMFTFCTRTVYLGADFYSDNARSFILSDANVECLAVDISLDLPQILGRLRSEDNPWKNWAAFYYKPLITSKKFRKLSTPEAFNEYINEKIRVSESLIKIWEDTKTTYDRKNYVDLIERDAKVQCYKNNYVTVSKRGQQYMKPVINRLVIIAERRAFDIQQVDYKDRFSVICGANMSMDGIAGEINDFFAIYDDLHTVFDKLKFVLNTDLTENAKIVIKSRLEPKIKQYLSLGEERIRATGYNVTRLDKELKDKTIDKNKLSQRIYSEFQEGQNITKKEIKIKLAGIYADIGLNRKAKASDIGNWFEIKESLINKSQASIKLISKK